MTLILMGLLVAAMSWLFAILFTEHRHLVRQWGEEEKDRLVRAERVRRLTNRR